MTANSIINILHLAIPMRKVLEMLRWNDRIVDQIWKFFQICDNKSTNNVKYEM